MNPTEFNKLAKYQQEVARLQKGLMKFNQKLLKLPAKFGFKSIDEFIQALRRAEHGKTIVVTRKRQRKASEAVNLGVRNAKAKRKRATITPEIKQKVKSLLAAEKTGAEIAKAVEISLPSVQNIKKELGLVTKRGK